MNADDLDRLELRLREALALALHRESAKDPARGPHQSWPHAPLPVRRARSERHVVVTAGRRPRRRALTGASAAALDLRTAEGLLERLLDSIDPLLAHLVRRQRLADDGRE